MRVVLSQGARRGRCATRGYHFWDRCLAVKTAIYDARTVNLVSGRGDKLCCGGIIKMRGMWMTVSGYAGTVHPRPLQAIFFQWRLIPTAPIPNQNKPKRKGTALRAHPRTNRDLSSLSPACCDQSTSPKPTRTNARHHLKLPQLSPFCSFQPGSN